ncbi:MAG: hypothetical protein ABIT83_13330 [Massilia sp.]
MSKLILSLLAALAIAACSRESVHPEPAQQHQAQMDQSPDSGEGALYIEALASAVQKSDRIVITEHSIGYDVLDEKTQPQLPVGYVPIIYAEHALTNSERSTFLVMIRATAPKPEAAEPACIFEPHHTISFYSGKVKTSTMQICYQCGQVEWDGTNKQRPWALISTLKWLAASAGMKADRDWIALAKGGVK